MKPNLLLSLSNACDGECDFCTLKVKSERGSFISYESLKAFAKLAKDVRFREAVILCPNPLDHPHLPYILSLIEKLVEKVCLFIEAGSLSKVRKKKILATVDELVLIAPSYESLAEEESRIKMLLSHGFEKLSVWLVFYGHIGDVVKLYQTVALCRKYGLRLRVGEPPFTRILNVDPGEALAKMKRIEIGLRHGTLYGYCATKAFIANYPVTLLSKPIDLKCRKVFIDSKGRVGKCPALDEMTPVENISPDVLRRIIYSKCPADHVVLDPIPIVNVSLRVNGSIEIPYDVLMLLEVVDQLKSFRAACEALGFPPSTYSEKIKNLERELKFKLLSSSRGGKSRGKTLLTARGKHLLHLYKNITEKINKQLYVDHVYFT